MLQYRKLILIAVNIVTHNTAEAASISVVSVNKNDIVATSKGSYKKLEYHSAVKIKDIPLNI